VRVTPRGSALVLEAEARGEPLDPARHRLLADVKAVTLHRLRVERTVRGWEASVVLDI
jgi:SHS2 domain-containing protein